MLKKVKKTSDNDYTLEISLDGKEYQQALANYSSFIPDYLKESFESDLFPKGKTPLAVIEERHGNELYRYILEANAHVR